MSLEKTPPLLEWDGQFRKTLKSLPSPWYPKPAGDKLYAEPLRIDMSEELSNGGVVTCTYTDYAYQPYVIPNGTITPTSGKKPIGSTIELDYNGMTITGGARQYTDSSATQYTAVFTWTAVDGYTATIEIYFRDAIPDELEPLIPTRTATDDDRQSNGGG